MSEAPRAAGIILRAADGLMLLLRRAEGAPDHEHAWCWPGGGIEDGETPEQAARRELLEETGIGFTGPLTQVDDRAGFITFLGDTKYVEPTLNDEHDDWIWVQGDGLPDPMHPGTLATLQECDLPKGADMTADAALRRPDKLAFDRSSARRIDPASGHMHVAGSNISKATVNPYYGREIPGWQELGLEAEKIYQVLRPAAELEKAAQSFVGKPLVIIHKAMSADDHDRTVVVGALTRVWFEHPYLKADLSIWDGEAIAGIESDEQRELSCGYGYVPVLQSGTFEGQDHEIVMTEIGGNHTALVEEGRAGPDVLVSDAKPKGLPMKLTTKALPSRKALLLQGALSGLLVGKLAADASLDLSPALDGVTRANFKAKKTAIAKAVEKSLKGKLAQDEELGELVENVAEMIDSLTDVQSGEPDDDDLSADEDPESEKDKKDEPKGLDAEAAGGKLKEAGMDEETCKKVMDALFGAGEPEKKDKPAEDEDKVDQKAMDAAIQKAKDDTRRDTIREIGAIAEAKAAVKPFVGELPGSFGSANEVYRLALDHAIDAGADIDLTGIPASAYAAMVKMLPQPGAKAEPKREQAHDSKSVAAAHEMFPGLARIKQA